MCLGGVARRGGKRNPTANHIVEALSGTARPAGVDMFLHLGKAQTEPGFEDIQRRAEIQTPLLGEILHQAEGQRYWNWGINE